jgi:hypothetical protein
MSTPVGYVYILTNKHVPKLVKVGFTARDPYTRADELSNVTGVPGKWKVFHSWELENAYDAEQEIFSELKRYRETGEYLRLRPDDAVEKISVVLAASGRIDSDGLSQIAREKSNRLKDEKVFLREQEDLKQLFAKIENELSDAENEAYQNLVEKNLPAMKRSQVQNAFIWGGSTFLVASMFVPKIEGALFLTGIISLFAYFMGDGWVDITNSTQANHARTEAIKRVWTKHGFGYLFSGPVIGYRDNKGFVFDDADQYEYDGFYTLTDKRSRVKYQRDRDYVSIGKSLPYFKIVFPTKRIIPAK